MLEGEDVLKFCLKHKICIEQFFFMYLIARKDFHLSDKVSLGRRYLNEGNHFKPEDIRDLVDRGFVENFNSAGQYYPELYMLTPLMEAVFANEEMAEELWDKYPATFRLHEKGSRFLARGGGDKDEILTLYLQKINFSRQKHAFVMEQLANYVSLVDSGQVNGYKLIDFIKQELWDTIATIRQEGTQSYGRDI
jgi:hypothetical protein